MNKTFAVTFIITMTDLREGALGLLSPPTKKKKSQKEEKPAGQAIACEQAPSWRIKHSNNSARSAG